MGERKSLRELYETNLGRERKREGGISKERDERRGRERNESRHSKCGIDMTSG